MKHFGYRPRLIGSLIEETRPAAVANDLHNFLEELTTALEAEDDVGSETMPVRNVALCFVLKHSKQEGYEFLILF